MRDYQVIIVGAGLVGLSCALSLLQQGITKLALVDAQDLSLTDLPTTFQRRVSAINPASQAFLQQIGAWQNLPPERLSPFRDIQVMDVQAQLNFHAKGTAQKELGHIIENAWLQQALLKQLREYDNISWFDKRKLTDCQRKENGYRITLDDQQHLHGHLLIGADGALSKVRALTNFNCKTHDYHHHALVTTIKTQHSHQHIAKQWFLTQGPLALLPLSDPNHYSIVWSSHPDHIAELKTKTWQQMAQDLTTICQQQVGTVDVIDQAISFPLIARRAQPSYQEHVVLIGDSAHTIHPLAGLGANIGLMDAACLAKIIAQALSKQRLHGTADTLARYHRQRIAAVEKTLYAMSFLKWIFGQEDSTICHIRRYGLKTLDKLPFIKNKLIQQALWHT